MFCEKRVGQRFLGLFLFCFVAGAGSPHTQETAAVDTLRRIFAGERSSCGMPQQLRGHERNKEEGRDKCQSVQTCLGI